MRNTCFCLLLFSLFACSGNAQDYDIVILNGRVMDPETDFDAIRNVGILDGSIAAITVDNIDGQRVIDASGLVVAPGFIDTHFHSLSPFGVKLALRDGLTTGMDLEVGVTGIADWYAEKQGNWQANFGTTISQEGVRQTVLDGVTPKDVTELPDTRAQAARNSASRWSTHLSSAEELQAILDLLDQGLREGALGVGSTLGYMKNGVSAREQFETQGVAAKFGRLTAVHFRYSSAKPPMENAIAAQEVLANAMVLNAPLLLQHINFWGYQQIDEMAALARQNGHVVWAEVYPYLAGSTTIGADILKPEVWEDNLGLKYEETILNPQTGQYLSKDEYLYLAENDPGLIIVGFLRRAEWMPDWLRMQDTTIGSDSMMATDANGEFLDWDDPYEAGAFHPRTAGSRAKTLRLGREYEISLMQSLRQLSYWSAKYLGDSGVEAMQVRGRMQEGMVADITIFDAQTVTDNATYETGENGLPSTGIPYVVVNGLVVVDDSEVLKDVHPGQAMRFNPIEKN